MYSLSRHNLDGVFFNEEDSFCRDPSLNLLCKQVPESPANVFARMKARVRREKVPVESKGANAEIPSREERDGQFNPIRKINQPWANCKQKKNNIEEFTHESETLTLSLGKSPKKGRPHPNFLQNTPTKGLPPDTVSVSRSPWNVFSHLKERNSITLSQPVTISPGKTLSKALAHPHKQDLQGLPPKVSGSGVSILTNRNTPIEGPAPSAFSSQSPQRAFSYSLAQLKANNIQQQAFPKDFQCGLEATIMPVRRSESAEGCSGKMEPNDIVHEEFVVRSPILDRRPSRNFTANDIFVLTGKGRKEQDHHSRPYSLSRGCGRYELTPACVTGGNTGNTFEKDTFVLTAVHSDLSETSVPVSPEAGPSCDPHSPRRLPGLVHDPLLQLTPKISLPRKREAVFQAKPTLGSNATSIQLKHWILKSRSNGLYVEGIRVDDMTPWHSNIITERISQNILMTTSGSTYVLEGQMDADLSKTELPASLLKNFVFGFPKNWKEYLERFLSTPKGESQALPRDQKLKATKRSTSQKTKRSVSCSDTSCATFSRSGRLLKPPLEYWKGARVILDCDMNVTIHGGYDNLSIQNSEQSTPVARVMSKGPTKSATICLPPAEEDQQEDSSEAESVPVRKVKAYHRPPKPDKKPGHMAPKSLRCRVEDNDPFKGAESLASQRCMSGDIPERMGPPMLPILRSRGKAAPDGCSDPAPRSLNTLRCLRRRAVKLSSGDNSENVKESPELLPGKLIKRFKKSECPRVLDMPVKGLCLKKIPAKTFDDVRMEPPVTARRVLRHNGSAAVVRWNNIQDSEQGSASESRSDEDAAEKRPKAKAAKPEPRKQLGIRTCGKVPGNLKSSLSVSLTSPSALQKDLRKMDSKSDDEAQKKGPSAKAVESGPFNPRVTRTGGRLLEDSVTALSGLSTSPDDFERDLRKMDSKSNGDDDDDYVLKKRFKAKAKKSGPLNPRVTRTRGTLLEDSVMGLNGMSISPDDFERDLRKMDSKSNGDDDYVLKKHSKAKAKKSEPLNPRVTRTRGTLLEDSVTALSGISTSPDDLQRDLTQSDDGFDDETKKKRSKAKEVKLRPVNPRGTRTTGRVLEDDDKSTKRTGPQNSSGRSTRCVVQRGEIKEVPEQWTDAELLRLNEAVTSIPKHVNDFWTKVAWVVSTRSAGDCQEQYNAQALMCRNPRRAMTKKKVPQKEDPCVEAPRITAKKGTLKRKQQVRTLLDHMPKDEHDDIFNSSPMQNKRIKLPTVSPNGAEDVCMRSEYDPQTPGSTGFPSVKTPQCLHITPGMMGSVNRNDDDKYIYQLQKRMKKSQVKLNEIGATSKCSPTPAAKRVIKRCKENESSFVVWEMFPDKDVSVESGEEDFYFEEED